MKIRVFSNLCNGVYRIIINTEDWSQGDLDLMFKYGEPELNVGGSVTYDINNSNSIKTFGDEYIKLFHGFPYARNFDSRDYNKNVDEAISIGTAWKNSVLTKIDGAIRTLRDKTQILPTEEINEI